MAGRVPSWRANNLNKGVEVHEELNGVVSSPSGINYFLGLSTFFKVYNSKGFKVLCNFNYKGLCLCLITFMNYLGLSLNYS